MARTSVDLVTDLKLTTDELNGNTDVTGKLFGPASDSGTVEWWCKTNGVKKVTMPDECKLLVAMQSKTWDYGSASLVDTLYKAQYARDWLGNPGSWGVEDGTQIVLDVAPKKYVTPVGNGGAVLCMFQWDNMVNGQVAFKMNAQAQKTMDFWKWPDRSGGQGTGFAVHGIKATACKFSNTDLTKPDMAVSYLNFRSRTASGYGSAFCQEMIQGQGGVFWNEYDVIDGSVGTEAIVFHGYTFSGSMKWYVSHCRSSRMWRGMGCFNGGQGEVHDLVVKNLSGARMNTNGTAMNLEAGDTVQGKGAGGTPGPILLVNPKSHNSDIFVNVNNNYGSQVGNVQLVGGESHGDGKSIEMTGVMGTSAGAPAGGAAVGLYCSDAFFDTPSVAIVHLQSSAVATDVRMARCTFSPAGAKKVSSGSVPGAWDLTFGTGGTNLAPTLSNMTPADGATVTAGAAVTVSCKASDDNDSPGSGLTASGRAYLPAVNISTITVSGTTATVTTAAAHGATNGGKVRIKGTGVAALNGAALVVTSVADTTHFTYTVASGTSGASAGTVEPLGAAITMAAVGTTGFTGTWTAPTAFGVTRQLEITVTDSGSLSKTIASTVTTTTNSPPIVAVVNPAPSGGGQLNPATGQTLGAVVIDPNAGDTISSSPAPAYTVKDSGGATVLSGTLTAQTPAVNTTIAAAVADVTQLSGDTTDIVKLTSATGTSAPGILAVTHGTGIVVLAYGAVAGKTLSKVTTLSGTGALDAGDTARSANYTATLNCSGLTAGATYTAQANATDNHSALGASASVPFTINTPPTLTWAFPVAGQTVGGTIAISVGITDDGGVANLASAGLYNNDTGTPVLIGAMAIDPLNGVLTYSFDTTTLTDNADHTLRARAVDGLGLVGTADITFHVHQGSGDTTGPTIASVTLADGTVVTGPIGFEATITDVSGVLSATAHLVGPNNEIIDLTMGTGT